MVSYESSGVSYSWITTFYLFRRTLESSTTYQVNVSVLVVMVVLKEIFGVPSGLEALLISSVLLAFINFLIKIVRTIFSVQPTLLDTDIPYAHSDDFP